MNTKFCSVSLVIVVGWIQEGHSSGVESNHLSSILLNYYRAMHVVLARYCYRKSSVRLPVRPSVRDVDVSWAYRLKFEINYANN